MYHRAVADEDEAVVVGGVEGEVAGAGEMVMETIASALTRSRNTMRSWSGTIMRC